MSKYGPLHFFDSQFTSIKLQDGSWQDSSGNSARPPRSSSNHLFYNLDTFTPRLYQGKCHRTSTPPSGCLSFVCAIILAWSELLLTFITPSWIWMVLVTGSCSLGSVISHFEISRNEIWTRTPEEWSPTWECPIWSLNYDLWWWVCRTSDESILIGHP